MGQEILYCFKCQSRIVSSDFDRGDAYRIDDKAACAACTRELLPSFPLKRQREILNQAKKAESPTPDLTPKTPRRAVTASSAPAPSSLPLVAAIVAGLALILVLLLVFSGGSGPRTPAPQPGPVPPPAAPVSSDRERAAKVALDLSRAFARDNPSDLDGQVRLAEKVASEYAGTPAGAEARRDAEALAQRRKAAIADELAALAEEARPMIAAEDFQKAIDLFEAAKKRRAQEEWTGPIDAKVREVREAMARLFTPLKDRAVEAKKKGKGDDVRAARTQVAHWGVSSYSQDLENALAAAVPPVAARADGLLHLRVNEATVVGKRLKKVGEGDWSITQTWGGTDEYLEWAAAPRAAGTYTISMNYACPMEWAGEITVTVGDESRTFKIEPTTNWGDYKSVTLGTIPVPAARCRVAVQPAKLASGGSMSLRFLNLIPPKSP